MARLVVPVRYPLTNRSKRTLSEAFSVAHDYDADITILHVNLYQNSRNITQTDLQYAVEAEFGRVPHTEYVVRTGFLVEETIIDEVIGENADIVVVGQLTSSRWRRLLQPTRSPPDIETALRDHPDCTVITSAT
jgi:nucleotide-binding universal stress UspA family protein